MGDEIRFSVPEPSGPPDLEIGASRFRPDTESFSSEHQISWAVGQALTEWEDLESAFASCYGTMVQDNTGIAYASYGTLTSSRFRGELLQQAIARRPKWLSSCADELKVLLKLATKFADRRNEIAHGAVRNLRIQERDSCYLCPATYSTRHFIEESKCRQEIIHKWMQHGGDDPLASILFSAGEYAYSAPQILYYRDRFREIARGAFTIASRCWHETVEARRRNEAPIPTLLKDIKSASE